MMTSLHRFRWMGPDTVLVVACAVWMAAIVAAPLLELDWVYTFFSRICHQYAERSFHLAGAPLAVCIRCTSIYAGFLIALLAGLGPSRRLLIWAIGLTAVEFLIAGLFVDIAPARVFSGLLLGSGAAGFVREGIRDLFVRSASERSSV